MNNRDPSANGDTPDADNEAIIAELLAVRQHGAGLVASSERLLEALGRPVESIIINRRQRRHLTQRTRKRNI